jgi:hypothetical protein
MNSKLFALTSILASSFASQAWAQQAELGALEVNDKIISVSGSGYQRSFPCNGRKLEVAGSGHKITTTGECSHVDVSGAQNTVDVTLAPKGKLEVSGSSHTVRWQSSGQIKQDISGADHRVTRVK